MVGARTGRTSSRGWQLRLMRIWFPIVVCTVKSKNLCFHCGMLWCIHEFCLTCQGNSCEPHNSHEFSTCLEDKLGTRGWCGPSTTKSLTERKNPQTYYVFTVSCEILCHKKTSHLFTYPNRWQHRGPRDTAGVGGVDAWWFSIWLGCSKFQRMSKTTLSIWDKNIASSQASTKKSGWFHSRINAWQPKRIA